MYCAESMTSARMGNTLSITSSAVCARSRAMGSAGAGGDDDELWPQDVTVIANSRHTMTNRRDRLVVAVGQFRWAGESVVEVDVVRSACRPSTSRMVVCLGKRVPMRNSWVSGSGSALASSSTMIW
jgi:hypothetical protein